MFLNSAIYLKSLVWSTLLIVFRYAWLIVCLLGCLIAWLIVLWGCLKALRLIVFIGCLLSYKVDSHVWLSLIEVNWTISMFSLDHGFGNYIQCCQFQLFYLLSMFKQFAVDLNSSNYLILENSWQSMNMMQIMKSILYEEEALRSKIMNYFKKKEVLI